MNRHNLGSRNEKIKFLQKLKKGQANISDLLPMSSGVWWISEDNGATFHNSETKETLTKKEYENNRKENDVVLIGHPGRPIREHE